MLLSRKLALLSLCFISACSQSLPKEVYSWGKGNVSFADYRVDSVTCALEGVQTDVVDQDQFKEIDAGLREQERSIDNSHGDIFDAVRENSMLYQRKLRSNVAELQDYMIEAVHECLRNKGYSEFALTGDQSALLAKLDKGSEARFRYLHALASDPLTLGSQSTH